MERLRRLDALFAERVLGYKPPFVYVDINGNFDWIDQDLTAYGPVDTWKGIKIDHYTRSLDAAWEGMQHIHLDRSEFRKVVLQDDTSEGSNPYHASVWGYKSGGDGYASHPAEALVLACLRAVGVTEDELKCLD